MRSADAVSLFRIVILFVAIYLIALKLSALAIILLLVLLFALDLVDGFLAKRSKKGLPKYGANSST